MGQRGDDIAMVDDIVTGCRGPVSTHNDRTVGGRGDDEEDRAGSSHEGDGGEEPGCSVGAASTSQ